MYPREVGRPVQLRVPAEATQGNGSLQVPLGLSHLEVLWFKLDIMHGSRAT